MHYTSITSGRLFAEGYGKKDMVVVDVGGLDINGSLRQYFTDFGMKFVCVDLDPHPSVDIVIKPGDPLPFETGTVDIVVSSSCFEHDPCFWITFKEITRIVKLGGYIYASAPNQGGYHGHPGDNWRFNIDAGQALAYWSGLQMYPQDKVYPTNVVETFIIPPLPEREGWYDWVCIWRRTPLKDIEIVTRSGLHAGTLEYLLVNNGIPVIKK